MFKNIPIVMALEEVAVWKSITQHINNNNLYLKCLQQSGLLFQVHVIP
jgi:hypothetical protein